MQLLACFWIALCLVVCTSTKSITSTDEETSTGDLPIWPHGKADENTNADPCKPNPCQKEGECKVIEGNVTCLCKYPYVGPNCTVKCECKDGTCEKNEKGKYVCVCPPEWGYFDSVLCKKCACGKDASCTFSGIWTVTKTCLCKTGYEDKDGFCKGTCNENPCLNKGNCTVEKDDIKCNCKKGFSGELCEKEDFCNPNPCKNGGRCLKYSKKCTCSNAYTGEYCEKCKCENGFCKEIGNEGNSVCACRPEWGLEGDTKCKKCDCGDDSNCTITSHWYGDSKICLCKVGYEDVDGFCKGTCKENPCLNGGVCTVVKDGIKCKCKDDFSGELCEKKDFCNPNPCKNGGSCRIYSQKCVCSNAYTGEYCEKCKCENGFCKEIGNEGNTVCACQPEWGVENDIKCKKCDCGDDSNCTITVLWGSYNKTCLCKVGYEDVDGFCKGTCKENPCLNGGVCTVVKDGIKCKCKDDFSGELCEKKDICWPNPCQNGGICNATSGKATCQCKDPFTGDDCSINVCSPNPCQNGGICNATRGEVMCQCKDRFRGADCSVDVCSPSPCQNGGICNVTRGQASCQCKDRFKGAYCSIDVCSPNPCKNGGICNATRGEAKCQCTDPFTGTDCSISPCNESPCQNGGTCVVVENRPKCLCKKPYLGSLCEIDHCDWNPCKNGGVCKTEYETVRCFCREPFTGEFCESRIRTGIDTYVITLVAGSVFLAVILTFVTCILCQRYHVLRTRSEYS